MALSSCLDAGFDHNPMGDALLISSLWANEISEIELIKNLKDAVTHTGVKKSVDFPSVNISKQYETIFYFDYICYTLSFSLFNDAGCISLAI